MVIFTKHATLDSVTTFAITVSIQRVILRVVQWSLSDLEKLNVLQMCVLSQRSVYCQRIP